MRFISVVICVHGSFLFIAKWYSIVRINHILLIHLPVNEHLGYFQILTIMNNVAKNFHVQIFVWTFVVVISPGYIPKSGFAGLQGK